MLSKRLFSKEKTSAIFAAAFSVCAAVARSVAGFIVGAALFWVLAFVLMLSLRAMGVSLDGLTLGALGLGVCAGLITSNKRVQHPAWSVLKAHFGHTQRTADVLNPYLTVRHFALVARILVGAILGAITCGAAFYCVFQVFALLSTPISSASFQSALDTFRWGLGGSITTGALLFANLAVQERLLSVLRGRPSKRPAAHKAKHT